MGKISLTIHIGNSAASLTYPDGAEITIGREVGNTIAPVESSGLSRRHARIFLKDGNWLVEDLGSTNGTFLGKEKISAPAKLKAGDKLHFAQFGMAVEWIGDPPADEEPPAPVAAEPPKPANPLSSASPAPAPASPAPAAAPAPDAPAPAKPAPASDAAAPAAPAPAAAPAAKSPIKPVLRPGLKLPPSKGIVKPGLKLPSAKPGIKPGLKLPPKPGLKPMLKLPPKPGTAPTAEKK